MKYHKTGEHLAKDVGISLQTLVYAHDHRYQASQKATNDLDGGSYKAYPSGKLGDAPCGKLGSCKIFYQSVFQGSKVASEEFYVAIITLVINCCMGGLEIDVGSSCISGD